MRMPLLMRQYGAKEIGLIMGIIQKTMARTGLIGDDALARLGIGVEAAGRIGNTDVDQCLLHIERGFRIAR